MGLAFVLMQIGKPQKVLLIEWMLNSSMNVQFFYLQPVESWLQSLDATEYRPILSALFDKYVEATMEYCRRNFKTVVPLPAINQAMTVCKILEGILPKVTMHYISAPSSTMECSQTIYFGVRQGICSLPLNSHRVALFNNCAC